MSALQPPSPLVLLVEDEPEARATLARALRRAGLETVEAADATTAIDALRARPIDLAILDLVLGDDDRGGLSVLTAMRELGHRGAAVVITAFADVGRLKKVLNLGASYLLEKPFRAAELVAIVQKLLAERSAGGASAVSTASGASADGGSQDLGGLVAAAVTRAGLTERETQVAHLVLKGLPSAEIAAVLGGSEKTIRQHISSIYEKCGVSSRPEFFHYVFPF